MTKKPKVEVEATEPCEHEVNDEYIHKHTKSRVHHGLTRAWVKCPGPGCNLLVLYTVKTDVENSKG